MFQFCDGDIGFASEPGVAPDRLPSFKSWVMGPKTSLMYIYDDTVDCSWDEKWCAQAASHNSYVMNPEMTSQNLYELGVVVLRSDEELDEYMATTMFENNDCSGKSAQLIYFFDIGSDMTWA